MRGSKFALTSGMVAFVALGLTAATAAPNASEQDKAFVAKVSQGGMYEVELGKVAESKGQSQDIKDQGNTETHDHEGVGKALKTAADDAGIEFSADLNAEFKARLAKFDSSSGAQFDKAYVEDMKKIHDADGAAFKKEAKQGTNPALKAFAASTYDIVQRHIGELDAKTTELK
jgi:putative membrane protein